MVISLRFVLFIDLFTVIVTTMELGTRLGISLPYPCLGSPHTGYWLDKA